MASVSETSSPSIDALVLEETRLHANIEVQKSARANLEASIETAHRSIQKLIKELRDAKTETARTREELDEMTMREASMLAQIDVVRTSTARLHEEIDQLRGPLQELQQELQGAQTDFESAREALATIDGERSRLATELDEVKREYRNAVAQQTRAEAEIEMAQTALEETRRRTTEIQARMTNLEPELEDQIRATTEAREDLRQARFAEARQAAQRNAPEHVKRPPPGTDISSERPESQQERPEQEPSLDQSDPRQRPQKQSSTNFQGRDQASVRLEEIYRLADAGHSVTEISQATQTPQGRIELLLRLRGLH